MTIKTLAITGWLSATALLATAGASSAATPSDADQYRQDSAILAQEIHGNPSLGTEERSLVDTNRHVAEWLHQQGRDAEAIGYLEFAIGQANQPN